MKFRLLLLIACVVFIVGCTSNATDESVATADGLRQMLAEPHSIVEGKTIGEWTIYWWQWGLSSDDDPILDETGELCGSDQNHPIWFLAGSYSQSPIVRTCTVPADTHLLMPLTNTYLSTQNDTDISCDQLKEGVKRPFEDGVELSVELDGESATSLDDFREASDVCIDLDLSGTGNKTVASDGYWIVIKPLEKGEHQLRITSQIPYFSQDITYNLIVE